MAGTAGSDLAELAGLGQVISDPLPEPAWRRPADRLHPGPWVEVPAVVAVLRQDHDTLRRVLEIRSDHRPSVAEPSFAQMSFLRNGLQRETIKGQAAEERDRPDERRVAFEEEARLGRGPPAAGRATCAKYCVMTD
jgi:hypothetical protein